MFVISFIIGIHSATLLFGMVYDSEANDMQNSQFIKPAITKYCTKQKAVTNQILHLWVDIVVQNTHSPSLFLMQTLTFQLNFPVSTLSGFPKYSTA